MTFLEARRGDADQTTTFVQRVDRTRARVPHGDPQPTDELIDHLGKGSAVGNLSFDSFGNQRSLEAIALLKVPVLGVRLGLTTRLHGAQRSHSSVGLELFTVDEDEVSRAFLATGEQLAEHDGVGTGHDGLGDVTGVLDATVADDGNVVGPSNPRSIHNRTDLGCAHTGYDTGGANGTRPHPHLDRIGTGLDERTGTLPGGDVASDEVDAVTEVLGQPAIMSSTPLLCPWEESMTSASTTGLHQRAGTFVLYIAHPDGGGDTQPTRIILVASGYCSRLAKSLTVMRPRNRPASSTIGSFSTLLRFNNANASSVETPSGAVTSGDGVMTWDTMTLMSVSNGCRGW